MTTIVVTGLNAVQAALKRLQRITPRPVMRAVALQIQEQVERRIESEKRAPNGLRWAPWSRGYARTRRPEHSLLIDTGRLLESFRTINVGSEVQMGTDVEYARKNDKEREFMGLSESNKREVRDVIDEWLRERLR